MSGELNIKYSATGKTVLALILGSNRTTRWNGTAMIAISSVTAANWTTGMVTLTEQATSDSTHTATYVGDFPAGITSPGDYAVEYYLSTATTPGSQAVGMQNVWWNGTQAIRPAGVSDLNSLIPYPIPFIQDSNQTYYPTITLTGNDLGIVLTNISDNAQSTFDAITAALPANPTSGSLQYVVKNNLNAAVGSVLSAVQNVQNNTFIAANIPPILDRPDTSSNTVQITIAISDETGAAKDIDSSANPTVVLVNNAGTDRSSRLSSWTKPSTGKYTATYTNTSTDALENLYWEITATVNSKLRRYIATTQLVDTTAVDFTSSDRSAISGIATQIGTAGSGLTALGDSRLSNLDAALSQVKTKTDKIPNEPAAVGSAMTLESAERDAIAAALLDLANAVDGKTLRQALRIIAAVLAGKVSGAGSGTETFRGLDDQNDRVVVHADVSGNRTDVIYQ
jgi:hypothetical protein